ncbi:probable E3 ubiquitin-protein ligase RNF217 [Neltuma alba]|uniref:probable E3 ubiquitin-protein ligase RNF217 n=1 Tax=Neltuma alba TaxID=207710 RepID=UPI0010A47B21|nr:probable E3 ubiquitin-protein ligase RNF217 [Prosopis alba]
MAPDSVSDLLCEILFFSSFFFCFVATELLCIEYPFFAALFFQHEEDDHHQHAPLIVSEYPQRSRLPKFINPSFIISLLTNNSSSLLLPPPPRPPPPPPSSSSSSSASSPWPNPETKHAKSAIKIEEPLEVICEICAETKRPNQMIKNQTCRHSYCSDCMTKHVATKVQDTITAVPCPGLGCKSVYELEACRPWIPKDLLERWDKALCEALFLQVPKFYCPFKDCSAMMLVENEMDQTAARETECPICHRLFCPRCNVPWHHGVDCEEYQGLNENERQREDLLVRQLVKDKKWGRCPKCKFYVEKTQGCLHITCRCKYEFCYKCGKEWNSSHGGCQRY